MGIVEILGHVILFIAAGGASYGITLLGKNANWPFVVIIVAPIIGVYFLGWWALLTYFLGWFSGSRSAMNQKLK